MRLSHVARSGASLAAVACLALAAGAGTATAGIATAGTTTARPTQGSKAKVACKRLHHNLIRCSMTLKSAAGISGTVSMRITRGRLVVAVGNGRVNRGKATLTMRLLRPMPRGRYTVTMTIRVNARMVLRLG
jgi:hypothetical protein